MTFKKGLSGNPGGRSSQRPFQESLVASLKSASAGPQQIRRVTDALVDSAIAGDLRAIEIIAQRLDGKPVPHVDEEQAPSLGEQES